MRFGQTAENHIGITTGRFIAVTIIKRMGALAMVAGFAIAGLPPAAMAQKAPGAATAATPATQAAPASPAKTTKPAVKPAKIPSPCKGLEEAACAKMGETCSWIAAATRKDGKAVKAHCRKKAGFAAKKPAAAKAAAPAKTTPPATTTTPATQSPTAAAAKAAKKAVKPPPAATN